MIPALRNAPQAPPKPLPRLNFSAADTTMLMSAIPYVTPSATPAYTGTIYVSYAASRAKMAEADEAAERPEEEQESAAKSVARNSAIMALGSIVSRFTGFLRVAVLGAAIGAGVVGDTYTAANTVPSMVYELLLGGILTSVLVPLLVRAKENDPDKGQAFTQRLLTLAVLTLGAATVLAVAAAPLLTAVMASDNHGEAERQLMTSLAYLLLPEVFFFGIAGILAAVLNTRGHFAAPMWTPILNNVVVIGTAVVFMLISDQPTLTPENMTSGQILVLGVGTTLGIAVQAIGLIPALRKVGFRWRWRFDFRELQLGELGRIAGWMLCYVAVSQIGVVVIIRLAYAAGSAEVEGGGKAAGAFIYNNAFLLFMMAHGIVAVSIITALMPRMSAAAAKEKFQDVARNISLGTRLTSVVLIPVTAAYLVLGGAIAAVLFQWGRYTEAEARSAALVVAVAGLGLVPFAISQLQTFAFYALTETKTAALVNIPVVATKVAVDIAIYYSFPAQYIAAGLMVGNLCSYILGAVISGVLLRKRLGPMGQGQVFATLVRLAIAGVVGGFACLAVLYPLNMVLPGDDASSMALKIADITRIVVGGLVLVAVYLATAWVLRVREISDVVDMVNRKLGGRLPLPGRNRSRTGQRDGASGDDAGTEEDDAAKRRVASGTARASAGRVRRAASPAPGAAEDAAPSYDTDADYPRRDPRYRESRYPDQADHPGASYPDQGSYPEPGGYPNQASYPDRAGRSRGSRSGDHQPGYGDSRGYSQEASYRGPQGYRQQAGYSDQDPYPTGYRQQPYDAGYADSPEYPDRPGYPGGSGYADRAGYSGRPGPAESSGYSGSDRYSGGAHYPDDPGYPDGPRYPETGGYRDGYGYLGGSGYRDGSGYRSGSGYQGGSDYRSGSRHSGGTGYRDSSGYSGGSGYPDGSDYSDDSGYRYDSGYQGGSGYPDDAAQHYRRRRERPEDEPPYPEYR